MRSRREVTSSKTHVNAATKQEENERIRNAFGIPADRKSGEAFTEEFAAEKKKERQEAWERREQQYEERKRNHSSSIAKPKGNDMVPFRRLAKSLRRGLGMSSKV